MMEKRKSLLAFLIALLIVTAALVASAATEYCFPGYGFDALILCLFALCVFFVFKIFTATREAVSGIEKSVGSRSQDLQNEKVVFVVLDAASDSSEVRKLSGIFGAQGISLRIWGSEISFEEIFDKKLVAVIFDIEVPDEKKKSLRENLNSNWGAGDEIFYQRNSDEVWAVTFERIMASVKAMAEIT